MCGICGYISTTPAPAALEAMSRRISHRGPDGSGAWSAAWRQWHVGLGHRRLAIIDLEGGKQPLGNEDGSVQITFNGEVYNFRELRARLEQQGHRFATRSDTEVIVHHHEQHGHAGLAQLGGMFAFAIWDQNRGELLLARDRVGIKPLYYAPTADGGLIFSSELTSLLEHPAAPRTVSRGGLASFLFLDYVHAPLTAIEGVRKLEPGHFVTWRDGKLSESRPFWKLSDAAAAERTAGDSGSLAKQLQEKIREAVAAQMIADVPLGVFLSGGVDSSTVAALAQSVSPEPIHTFSIGFEEPEYDESRFARRVASALGTHHTEEILHRGAMLEHLDAALGSLDEPMADPSIVPTFLLSRLAARHVKVAMGGDGGDELWGGYPTYKAHRYAEIYRNIPRPLRAMLIEPMVRRMRVREGYQTLDWKLKRFVGRWDDHPTRRHLRWMSGADVGDLASAINGLDELPTDWLPAAEPLFGDDMNSFLALDFTTYLPGSVLTKVDRASMAHGLEVRPPLLDNALVDWAFSLASHHKLRGSTGKHLMKLAVAGLLPDDVIHRRKKGFGIPLAQWLKTSLKERVRRVLDESPLWESRSLNRSAFQGWFDEHLAFRVDHSKPLWAMIVLDDWARRAPVRFE